MPETLIATEALRKDYGNVQALRGVEIRIDAREIVGVAGDNGAGKSTLMKIIAGAEPPTSGHVFCEGARLDHFSPSSAREMGIDTVYQDLALCENLDVRENIFLGRELRRRVLPGVSIVDYNSMSARSEDLLQRLRLKMESVLDPVSALSGGQRQAVAIARALAFEPKLVILDEPTAALSVNASAPLLELITQLPEVGAAVMLVSHRLNDLLTTTNRIYVLRHGLVAGELVTSETDEDELLRMMAGLPAQANGASR